MKAKAILELTSGHPQVQTCGCPNSTIWFDDYEDRVIYDEAGLFDYARVDKKAVEAEPEVSIAVGS